LGGEMRGERDQGSKRKRSKKETNGAHEFLQSAWSAAAERAGEHSVIQVD
jgi:hypothetical protein